MSRLLLRYVAQVTAVAILLAFGIAVTAQDASQEERDHQGILHVGLWVTDVDEMLAFLGEISDFTKFAESERSTGGRRIFVHDAKGQVIELLTAPDVEDHPDFALHPIGRTAGVAHIAVRVDNTLELRNRLQKMGYEILLQFPANDDEGYVFMGIYGDARNLFLEGPSGVTFELFEIRD